jgi:hypothetical protein
MSPVKRQVGVSLPQYLKEKVYKVADLEGKTVSGFCRDAIAFYVDKWLVKTRKLPGDKVKDKDELVG